MLPWNVSWKMLQIYAEMRVKIVERFLASFVINEIFVGSWFNYNQRTKHDLDMLNFTLEKYFNVAVFLIKY